MTTCKNNVPHSVASAYTRVELVMVLAMLMVMVWATIVVFKRKISEARISQCASDLVVLRNAVIRHDDQNPPFSASDFGPLVGHYLGSLPFDPWGNPYLVDSKMGTIVSYGLDGRPGGFDQDKDHISHYRPELTVEGATYHGQTGTPVVGNYIVFTFNKPFRVTGDPTTEIFITCNRGRDNEGLFLSGDRVTLIPSSGAPGFSDSGWDGGIWTQVSNRSAVFPVASDPANGLLVIGCLTGSHNGFSIGPDCRVNLRPRGAEPACATLRELMSDGGPFDPSVFPGCLEPGGARSRSPLEGQDVGVPFEFEGR